MRDLREACTKAVRHRTITLNVRGTMFTLIHSILTNSGGPQLRAMVQGSSEVVYDEQGRPDADGDADAFERMLYWLQTKRLTAMEWREKAVSTDSPCSPCIIELNRRCGLPSAN